MNEGYRGKPSAEGSQPHLGKNGGQHGEGVHDGILVPIRDFSHPPARETSAPAPKARKGWMSQTISSTAVAAKASIEDMRTTIETGLQRLPGRGGTGDVLAGFEKVLRDAIRATPEGRALSAEDVDARVGDWGWGRPPYLRPVRVEY